MRERTMTTQAGQVRQIASAAGVVGGATLLSRVLGFVRDMAIAWLFGAGMMADAFFVAFRIPSTLRELLGEGALSAAFVPTFTRTATREGRAAAWDLASAVMGTLVVVLAVVAAAGVLLAPGIIRILAPGFAEVPGKLTLTVQLLRVMFPYIFLVGLAALFMAILNSLGHFMTPALSPSVLNVCMIVAALFIAPHASNPVLPLGIAVLVGGAGQLLIQVPSAMIRGWRPRLRVAPRDPRVQEIARLMAPGVAGLAITQINVFVGTLLASLLAQGSVAALTYAFRLVQFPIGVFGVAIATGALPVMAASAARNAMDDMKRALMGSLRLGFFLALPAMVGLLIFRTPILHVLFERGAFTRPVTFLTAEILAGYTLGICFYIANRILAPAFYAMHDTWTPVATGMMAVGVNIAASIALMGPLGATGLALATAIASAGNFLLLFSRLRRRIGPLGGKRLLRAVAKVGLACLPMAAWGIVSQGWWDVLAVPRTVHKAALLCGEMGVAVALFGATAAALGCDELRWSLDLLRRQRPGEIRSAAKS
ncbi:MAG: murein biosynthesis integral membrane protein MurJ [candidate division NC10 bacterium]|nr:murein biosynthesis integral membrane protein MurJ [candidate division NC10 bacterium]